MVSLLAVDHLTVGEISAVVAVALGCEHVTRLPVPRYSCPTTGHSREQNRICVVFKVAAVELKLTSDTFRFSHLVIFF